MVKRIALFCALLLVPLIAQGQTITTTVCPGVGCINFNTAGQGTIGIQITGTWVGTITFQGTVDNTNYVTISVTPSSSSTTVTTATANGVWTTAVAGLTQVRIVFTAWTSGTATIIGRTTVTTKGATGAGGGGGGSGTVSSVDVAAPSALLTSSGGPVTTSGTITLALGTRAANLVFAGPTSGGVATPTFRALVSADMPAGLGTVTSIATTAPIAGGTITGTGTITCATCVTNGQFGIDVDGGGVAITTGVKGFVVIPYDCTIIQATVLSTDASATSGSIVFDVWKDTYANYPPTIADTITASAKPTLSSANKSQDSTLTGWTVTVTAGDVLAFNVDSASTVTHVVLLLKVVKR